MPLIELNIKDHGEIKAYQVDGEWVVNALKEGTNGVNDWLQFVGDDLSIVWAEAIVYIDIESYYEMYITKGGEGTIEVVG